MTDQDKFPPALPHGSLEEVFPDVFVVRGTFRMQAFMSIGRNMTIVREGKDLTVLNSVRLSPEGEAELAKLGDVKHVVRLGMAHGVDDPYFVSRYEATLWAPPKMKHAGGLTTGRELTEDGPGPLSFAKAFLWKDGAAPEAALLLEREGGILVTCDSLQNHVSREGNSFLAGLAMTFMGLMGPAKIGPPWRKYMEKGGRSLAADFQRVAELPFKHLLSAHGAPLKDTAHEAVRATVAAAYPKA